MSKMDDLISRQAAIEAFYLYPNISWTTLDVMKKINELPPAHPEQEYTMEEFVYGQDMGNPEDGSL